MPVLVADPEIVIATQASLLSTSAETEIAPGTAAGLTVTLELRQGRLAPGRARLDEAPFELRSAGDAERERRARGNLAIQGGGPADLPARNSAPDVDPSVEKLLGRQDG